MSPEQPGYGAPACHGRRPRVRSRSSRQFPSPLASARRLSFELSHAFTHATRSILPFFLLFFGANAELSCSMANTQTRRKMSVGISLDAPLSKSECPSSSSRVTGHESRSSALMPRPHSRHPRSHVSAIFLIFCAEHFSQRRLFIQPHE